MLRDLNVLYDVTMSRYADDDKRNAELARISTSPQTFVSILHFEFIADSQIPAQQ